MKQKDFLADILNSSVRARVLRLCVSSAQCVTVEEVAARTHLKKDAVVKELNALTRLGVIKSTTCTRTIPDPRREDTATKKVPGFMSDTHHEYHKTLASFIRDTELPAETSVIGSLKGVGVLKLIIVSGFLAGAESNPSGVELLIVGDKLNEKKIAHILRSVEAEQGREITYALFSVKDFTYRMEIYDRLIRDVLDYPHQVLLDRLRVGV